MSHRTGPRAGAVVGTDAEKIERSNMPGRFRSNVDRQFAYETKTKPERVKQTNDDMRMATVQNHANRQSELASYEVQAKAAIDTTGVSSILYIAYLNYCREIWKKANTYGGEVLKRETEAIIAKWKVRDLDETILKRLRFELINVQG
jgi:hypothetical protein